MNDLAGLREGGIIDDWFLAQNEAGDLFVKGWMMGDRWWPNGSAVATSQVNLIMKDVILTDNTIYKLGSLDLTAINRAGWQECHQLGRVRRTGG